MSVYVLVDAPAWFDCKSKKDDVFSQVHTTIRNAPNFDAKPSRQTWTISLSLMFTSIEAKESQMSLIFEV